MTLGLKEDTMILAIINKISINLSQLLLDKRIIVNGKGERNTDNRKHVIDGRMRRHIEPWNRAYTLKIENKDLTLIKFGLL